MDINTRFAAALSSVALFHTCSLFIVLSTATAQDVEIVLAELGGVSVVSIPQPSPLPGLLATKVVLRTAPENKFITFENVKITGAVHQVWVPGFHSPGPSPHVGGLRSFPQEWIDADSHILIAPSMVAGGAGKGHRGIGELNDEGNQIRANERLPLFSVHDLAAVTGIGGIAMWAETDAFFLEPEFQTNEIDFAYVVTPDDTMRAAGDVFLTVGVFGEGIINSGQPGGASFGFNGNDPVTIFSFIPEPTTCLMASMAFLVLLRIRRGIFVSEHVS